MNPQAPWLQLEEQLCALEQLSSQIEGKVHPSAVVEGVLVLPASSEIKAGTVIEGFVEVGENCSIGPNAYLRGRCKIGQGCRIGHAVEMKDCVLGAQVFVSHLSYLGDSLLEDDVNLGGGCILSNFRHDAGEIRMRFEGKLCPTGRQKLGAWIKRSCRLGCNSVVLPGRVLEEGTWLKPGSVFQG